MHGIGRATKCLLFVALFFLVVSAANAQLPGAIFTTLKDGSRVNANIYQTKCGPSSLDPQGKGVWLDGGPGPNAPQGAAGLPDGDYYFQVTDPSGKNLLSTDPVVDRQFHVSAGIISGLSGVGDHNIGFDNDHGATTIELCPFLDTTNPGGVYKAWVTPVGKFDGDPNNVDNDCGHGCFHGFVPAFSKVDNFKVKGTPGPCLIVLKFIDANGDGSFAGDTFVRWPLTIYDPLGAQINGTLYTDGSGAKACIVFNLVPGTYRVVEEATNNSGTFVVTANILDGVSLKNPDVEVLVRIRNSTRELIFGNAPVKK
jgi:hypothetical protein